MVLDPSRIFPDEVFGQIVDGPDYRLGLSFQTGLPNAVDAGVGAHLDATLPNFLMQEVIADPEPWKDAIVINPPVMDDEGFFAVPTAPGLGITLDLEAATRFPPVEGRPPALWHEDGSVADW